MTFAPNTTSPDDTAAPRRFDCPDCEDSGTTALFDVYGRMIDAAYCSCSIGARLHEAHDHQAAERIETTNARLGWISFEALKAVRAGLETL